MPVSTLSAPNPIKDIYTKLVFFDTAHAENAYTFMYTDSSTLQDVAITQVDNSFVLTNALTLKSTIKMSDVIPGGAQGSADNNPINIGQLHNDIYGIDNLQNLQGNYAPKHYYESNWGVTGKGLQEIDHLEYTARLAKDNEQDYELDKLQLALYGTKYATSAYIIGGVASDPENPYTSATNGWRPISGFIANSPTNREATAATTMLGADAILDKEVQHNRTWLQTAWNYIQGTDGGSAPSHPGTASSNNPHAFLGTVWNADGFYISSLENTPNPTRPGGAAGPADTTSLKGAVQALDTESRANEVWLNKVNKWIDSSDVDNTDQALSWTAPTDNWGEFSAITPAAGLTYTKDAIAGTASTDAMDAIKHLDMNMRHLRYLIDKNVDSATAVIDDDAGVDWVQNTNRRSLTELRADINALKTEWDGSGDTNSGVLTYSSTVGDSYANADTLHGDISEIDAQLEAVTTMITGATTAGAQYSTDVDGAQNSVEADIERLHDLSISDTWSHKNRLDHIVNPSTGKLENDSGDFLDMKSQRIKNVTDPTDLFDAANKGWVENQITGTAQGHGVQVCTYRLGNSASLQAAAGGNVAPGGGIMAVDTADPSGAAWDNKGTVTLNSVVYNHGGIALDSSTYGPKTMESSGVYIDGHLMVDGDLVLLTEEGATTEDGVSYSADPTADNHWSSGHAPDNEDWHWRNGIWVFEYSGGTNGGVWQRPSAGSALWAVGNSIAQGLIHPVEFGKDAGGNNVIWAFWTVQPETSFTYGTNTKICQTKAQAEAAFDESTSKNPRNAWAVFTGLQVFNAGNVTTIAAGNTVQVTLDAQSMVADGETGGSPSSGGTLGIKLSATSNADGVLQKSANGVGLNYDATQFENNGGELRNLPTAAGTFSTLSVLKDDTTNTGVTTLLTLSHSVSNTADDNIGGEILFLNEASDGNLKNTAAIQAIMTNADEGDTTYDGAFQFRTINAKSWLNAMRIEHDGKVGIGTITPVFPLQVEESGANSTIKIGVDSGLNGNLVCRTSGTGTTYEDLNISANDITINTASTDHASGSAPAITVKHTTQRVGLGTDSPSTILELKNTVDESEMITIDTNRGSDNDALGGLDFKWNGTSSATIYGLAGSDTTNKNEGQLAFWTTAGERVRINETGNVGIGTTNPTTSWNASSKLLHIDQNDTNGAILQLASSNTTLVACAGNNQAQIGTTGTEPIIFYTDGASNPRLRISETGDVGMNTSTPGDNHGVIGSYAKTLDINGGDYVGALSLERNEDTDGNGIGVIQFCNNNNDDPHGTGADSRIVAGIHAVAHVDGDQATDKDSGAHLDFHVKEIGSGTHPRRMRLQSTGFVGINEDNPTENLHISGKGQNLQTLDTTVKIDAATGKDAELVLAVNDSTGTKFSYGASNGFQMIDGGGQTFFKADASENVLIGYDAYTNTVNDPGTYGASLTVAAKVGDSSNTNKYAMYINNGYDSHGTAEENEDNSKYRHGLAMTVGTVGGGAMANTTKWISFRIGDGTEIGSIKGGTMANLVMYTSSSDERLKKNIESVNFSALDLIDKIKCRSFTWKKTNEDSRIGFIAQELYEVIPDAVSPGTDDVKNNPWSVSAMNLVPYLVKAVQELSTDNKQLKEDNELLKNQMNALDVRLKALEGKF